MPAWIGSSVAVESLLEDLLRGAGSYFLGPEISSLVARVVGEERRRRVLLESVVVASGVEVAVDPFAADQPFPEGKMAVTVVVEEIAPVAAVANDGVAAARDDSDASRTRAFQAELAVQTFPLAQPLRP